MRGVIKNSLQSPHLSVVVVVIVCTFPNIAMEVVYLKYERVSSSIYPGDMPRGMSI